MFTPWNTMLPRYVTRYEMKKKKKEKIGKASFGKVHFNSQNLKIKYKYSFVEN